MSSLYDSLLALPHSVAALVHLGLFYLINRKYYRDRLTIGLLFFALISVAFITMSAVIDFVVLFSLTLALCVQGLSLNNKSYLRMSLVLLTILIVMIGFFLHYFLI
ncbi:hypothetical protein [Companilactobacillus furfuricola]|uniref:hypothetical protein n=1 Tax=Companilactobacillus furfuricola TaxID=1462575 RepID=UPI0013DE322E|nr:hypothetical protein [Companilactobacillus furfuricola]